MIKSGLKYLSAHFVFWVFVFFVLRAFFLFVNRDELPEDSWKEVLAAFFYGLPQDLSVAGYLTACFTLLFLLFFVFNRSSRTIIHRVHMVAIPLVVLMLVVDARLYTYWGFRLDLTPFIYLKNPETAAASTSGMDVLFFMFYGSVLSFLLILIYRKWFSRRFSMTRNWRHVPAYFLFLAILFLPIRGGWDVAPMNISTAYYSNNHFLNHTAINGLWHFLYYVTQSGIQDADEFVYSTVESEENSRELIRSCELSAFDQQSDSIRPNVLMVVMESFSSGLLEEEWGGEAATPYLRKLREESWYFENVYATGDRTDKGLVGLLSGFPAQPQTSLINYPDKTSQLPSIFKNFREKGYSTSFIYGGDIHFSNMNAYLRNMGVSEIISKEDFPEQKQNGKWGVPDHLAFKEVIKRMKAVSRPYFMTHLTLSLHEPFDYPGNAHDLNLSGKEKYIKASQYFDHALQEFISSLKSEGLWDDLLVVLISDHGHRYLGDWPTYHPEKFRIPMYWTGGAIGKNYKKFPQVMSQVDVNAVLLDYLGWERSEYLFSKNPTQSSISFAYYAFKNGLGWVTQDQVQLHSGITHSTPDMNFEDAEPHAIQFQEFILNRFNTMGSASLRVK